MRRAWRACKGSTPFAFAQSVPHTRPTLSARGVGGVVEGRQCLTSGVAEGGGFPRLPEHWPGGSLGVSGHGDSMASFNAEKRLRVPLLVGLAAAPAPEDDRGAVVRDTALDIQVFVE